MKFLLGAIACASSVTAMAQPLTTAPSVRLWEHHSSAINDDKVFGAGANGSMSGYDFMNHTYFDSFDSTTFDEHPPAVQANIDMVEHNGKFGNAGDFGFTSGTSSIWGGDIKGNNLTKYFLAPAGFNYDTITNVVTIRNAYDSTMATTAVATAVAGDVYLVRVRNTNMYLAMKITDAKNLPANHAPGDTANVYFDFVYKYGTYQAPNNVGTVGITAPDVNIYPVPNNGAFTISGKMNCNCNSASIAVLDLSGKVVHKTQAAVKANLIKEEIDLPATLPSGIYQVKVTTEKEVEVVRFVKQ